MCNKNNSKIYYCMDDIKKFVINAKGWIKAKKKKKRRERERERERERDASLNDNCVIKKSIVRLIVRNKEFNNDIDKRINIEANEKNWKKWIYNYNKWYANSIFLSKYVWQIKKWKW